MAKAHSSLTENAIRGALLAQLRQQLTSNDLVIEELGVEHGAARVDVAVASDRLIGYEIKSDFDTLDRLARQIHAYHRVFDTLTIVTTSTYVDQVKALLPLWWGVVVAEASESDHIRLIEHRCALTHDRQEAESVAAMLWRDEAYAFLLEQLGPVVKAKAARHAIYSALAERVSLETIRARVLAQLRARDVTRYRLHVAGQELANSEDDMVAGRVPAPCGETA